LGVARELVDWLDSHTNFEAAMPGRAALPTLDRIAALCDLMGEPQRAAPVIHVTGTNGKGSTVKIITELLVTSGLTVGSYTSPDLASVNERIARNSEPISDSQLAEVLSSIRALEPLLGTRPTRFELLTAAAFRWFADVAVDVAVVEVGLGGRWDATNVVDPVVAVITNVSDDHLEVLGPTLEDVAREKAGIIKAGCHLVLGETDPHLAEIFVRAAETVGTAAVWRRGVGPEDGDFACDSNDVAVGGRLIDLRTPGERYEQVFLGLHGAHQGDNAAAALAAAEAFFLAPLDDGIVREALGSVRVPGRLETVAHSPLVLLDGAHNLAGAQALARSLSGDFAVDGPSVAVVGLLSGRDAAAFLRALASGGVSRAVMCPAPSPRAQSVAELLKAADEVGLTADPAPTVVEACELAIRLAGQSGLVVVTGSLYVVGEARTELFFPLSPDDSDRDQSDPEDSDPEDSDLDDSDTDDSDPDDSDSYEWTGFSQIPEIDGQVPR
jgi:dihydrofolate synthase/folylpolyglutamate synthase